MSASFGVNDASPPSRTRARSASQKNFASLNRAARTLRLPVTIAPPASGKLATQTNAGASAPSGPAQAKYFWLVRIVS